MNFRLVYRAGGFLAGWPRFAIFRHVTFHNYLRLGIPFRVAYLWQEYPVALMDLFDDPIDEIGKKLDARCGEAPGHCRRVAAFTIALAKRMGLPKSEIRVIARGAFLHNVGKLGISEDVLRRSGDPNQEERMILREHCALGYQRLSIPYLKDAAEVVYSQAECYDGSGYPRGLRGEQIPMGARIFAVAYALEVLTSISYFQERPFSTTRNYIERESGKQFDPLVVSVFKSLPADVWQRLRKNNGGAS